MRSARSKPNNAIIYVTIAIVLLIMVVAGVRWAKNRADYYYSTIDSSSEQSPQSNQGSNAPVADHSHTKKDSKKNHSNSVAVNPTSSLPSAGPEDYMLPIVVLALLAFTATKFMQTRRRLMAVR